MCPTSASDIRSHLETGGAVQVTTYLRSWIYTRQHADWFSNSANGSLYVRQGRGKVCLSIGARLVVGLRFSA